MAAGRKMAATAMQNQRERQKMGGMGGGRAGGGGGNGEMADMMRQMADRLDGGQGDAQGQIQKAAGVLNRRGAL